VDTVIIPSNEQNISKVPPTCNPLRLLLSPSKLDHLLLVNEIIKPKITAAHKKLAM
jgi:hypothetical protein